MSLNRFRKKVNSRIDLLSMLIKQKEAALTKSPDGYLIISKNKSVRYYYVDSSKNSRTYIKKENLELIRQLAQKSYDKDVLEKAREEKAFLEDVMNRYPSVTMEEYYESLVPERRELVNPVWLTDDEFMSKWQNSSFVAKNIDDKDTCFLTDRGEYVRSKSEKIIADKLYQRKVPYRYEAQLKLKDGEIIYPDFTILDMRTRSVIYWEHCGMMDDPTYVNNLLKRIKLYSKNGINIGDRLRLTFETLKVPLDVKVIEALIDDMTRAD